MGLILDSSFLIDAERGNLQVDEMLDVLHSSVGEAQLGLCSISVAELAHGIHRANTTERSDRRRLFLNEIKVVLLVYPVTGDIAQLVGRIQAETSAKGINIPFDDLLIGCCALEQGYAVATRNLRHFRKIPGLTVVEI